MASNDLAIGAEALLKAGKYAYCLGQCQIQYSVSNRPACFVRITSADGIMAVSWVLF